MAPSGQLRFRTKFSSKFHPKGEDVVGLTIDTRVVVVIVLVVVFVVVLVVGGIVVVTGAIVVLGGVCIAEPHPHPHRMSEGAPGRMPAVSVFESRSERSFVQASHALSPVVGQPFCSSEQAAVWTPTPAMRSGSPVATARAESTAH